MLIFSTKNPQVNMPWLLATITQLSANEFTDLCSLMKIGVEVCRVLISCDDSEKLTQDGLCGIALRASGSMQHSQQLNPKRRVYWSSTYVPR